MAHYAFIDDNNIVTEVIVGKDENEGLINWEEYYGNFRKKRCLRTSFNTYGNKHLNNGTPFRKNYAGVGYTYDTRLDAFIPPKPYSSWVLDEETCIWQAPVPMPNDGSSYIWDEESTSWKNNNIN
jgi:hypothetical protein